MGWTRYPGLVDEICSIKHMTGVVSSGGLLGSVQVTRQKAEEILSEDVTQDLKSQDCFVRMS